MDDRPLDGADLRRMGKDLPDAAVIDLGRRPSQGRDVGLTLRKQAATRHVPLVFAGGAPDKVDRMREFLPDAVYAAWSEIDGALERAIAHPPVDPVVPGSVFDVYAGTPLTQKLGIRDGSTVALIDAPEGFEATLGDLPQGAVVRQAGLDAGRVDFKVCLVDATWTGLRFSRRKD